MIKNIIFDMYGVIIEQPDANLQKFINTSFPNYTREYIYQKWELGGIGKINSEEFFSYFPYKDDLKKVSENYLNTLTLDPLFKPLIKELRKEYKTALLSNDFDDWNEWLRKKFALNPCFDAITVSGTVKLIKPQSEIYIDVLNKLGANASECIFIDDREKNLMAAKKIGMHTILFNRRKVIYDGYIIDSFSELPNVLEKIKQDLQK